MSDVREQLTSVLLDCACVPPNGDVVRDWADAILGRVVLELKEVNQSCDGLMFLSQDDVEAIGWVHPNCVGDLDPVAPGEGQS